MDFGIMFFSSAQSGSGRGKYRLLIEASKFADEHGFCCVWTPERHFHEFGGLFPNPSVTSAALSLITEKLQIRAGSLVSPLHDIVRIAEEWSVVDNLSDGRIAISFGSGWNVNDFIFFPDRYSNRQAVMFEQIDRLKALWRGQSITRKNSFDKEVELSIFPKPLQEELPIWVTSSGNSDTFVSAGAIGANILTHLIGQDVQSLSAKIRLYRESRERNNYSPHDGKVSLMLHTYLAPDTDYARDKVKTPFREYLRSAINLEKIAALGGGAVSGGHKIGAVDIADHTVEDLLDVTFDRYFQAASLMGSPEKCKNFIWQLKEIGVDEIACLIDFIDDSDAILESLSCLNELRAYFSATALGAATNRAVNAFLEDLEK
jgi:natural product biosynthesis luciferase-like monooxygenase protein